VLDEESQALLQQASTEQDSDKLGQPISRIIERLDAAAATPPQSASRERMEEKTKTLFLVRNHA